MNIKGFFCFYILGPFRYVLHFYYSHRPCFVRIPGLESSKLYGGAPLNQFGETCESLNWRSHGYVVLDYVICGEK